jgi:hypothetical protein
MIIDCGTCEMAEIACGDCVVSVLLGMPEAPSRPVAEMEESHVAAIEVLAAGGLVPPLRMVPGTGSVSAAS